MPCARGRAQSFTVHTAAPRLAVRPVQPTHSDPSTAAILELMWPRALTTLVDEKALPKGLGFSL